MKWVVLLAVVCLLAVPVAGERVTFQNIADYTDGQFRALGTLNPTGSSAYVQTAGGNNYVTVHNDNGGTRGYFYMLPSAEQTTYAAATYVSWTPTCCQGPAVWLLDQNYNIIWASSDTTTDIDKVAYSRVEINVTGGIGRLYQNGVLLRTSGALSQNPSYVAFGQIGDWSTGSGGVGTSGWDDVVYGSTETGYIFGMPENGYFLRKDDIGGAASGFYSPSGTIISNYNMSTSWGKSNSDSTTIGIYNVGIYNREVCNFTTTARAGLHSWPLEDCFFNNPDAPHGYYYISVYGSGVLSDYIKYEAFGASIAFDKPSYSTGQTATLPYTIDSGDYWNPVVYNYRMEIRSAGNWELLDSQSITTQTGTKTFEFQEGDPQGTVYAIIIAETISTGTEYWLATDFADLSGYMTISGYVLDAETGLPIENANVTFTQGSTTSITITGPDGNYTVNGLISGSMVIENDTATGYHQYYVMFTPATTNSVTKNISLNSTTPSYLGRAIGGIAREGTLTGNTITNGYGRPIENADVFIVNGTYNETYGNRTTMTGWYFCDEGSTCVVSAGTPASLPSGDPVFGGWSYLDAPWLGTQGSVFNGDRIYTVWGQKLGYLKSQNYTVMFT